MLTDDQRIAIADRLDEALRTKVQAVRASETHPGIDFEDAYAISSEMARRREARGARLIGHKIGLTSRAMQQSVGIDEPDYGYLFDDMLLPDGATVAHADFCDPRVEIEFSFILGKPLTGPGVGLVDVLRATEYVVPSIEVIDARFAGQRRIHDNIADNAAAAGLVLGGRPVRPDEVDLRWAPGALWRNTAVEETGAALGVLGHPALGVAWLANRLGPHGVTLEPGHIVLSGSFIRPVHARPGDTLRADFGALGSVSLRFE